MHINLDNIGAVTNKAFYPMYVNRDRYLILWGGSDSGKSYFCAQKLLLRIIHGANKGIKHKFLVLRKTLPAIRRSAFELLKAYIYKWGLNKTCKITTNPMAMTFNYGAMQPEIIFASVDDPEKLKSIEGVTGIWCEEGTELSQKDFREIELRIRGRTPSYKQIMISFNPIDETHWIKKEFFDRTEGIEDLPMDDKRVQRRKRTLEIADKTIDIYITLHHSTVEDNQWADPEDIAILDALKDKDDYFHRVRRLGLWAVLKGLIYDNWKVVKEFPSIKHYDSYGFGLDFGYTNNPSALVFVGFIGDDCYIRQGFYERALVNPQIASKIKSILPEPTDRTVADSAEPKSIQEICNAGINVFPCTKGKDSVVHGIQRVKQFNLMVDYESVDLIKELETYKWAVDKDDNVLNAPVDYMNHAMDAMRYIIVDMKGMTPVDIQFLDTDDDGREERKEYLHSAQYDPIEDDVLWEDV